MFKWKGGEGIGNMVPKMKVGSFIILDYLIALAVLTYFIADPINFIS